MNLIQAVALTADGATLEPLRVGHADEMVNVLADESIYSFIGGIPPTLESLRTRYDVQAKGVSPDGSEAWLNWIIRLVDTGQAVGYVQATVTDDGGCQVAEIAWVVSTPFQGRRLATNAAIAMCRFLVDQGVERLMADVHADHAASQGVARAAGLHPTDEVVDGEVRWIADVGSAGYRVRPEESARAGGSGPPGAGLVPDLAVLLQKPAGHEPSREGAARPTRRRP